MKYPEVNISNAILQGVDDPFLKNKNIYLYIKREDLIHPFISGNKWYKLKYNLARAKKSGYTTLLSFGGAYSNHIYALSAAGLMFGFNTIGVIRGEEHLPLNPTLQFAIGNGMHLHYLNRPDYRRKKEDEIINKLKAQFGDFYLIPEGGTNSDAVKGCMEIADSIREDFNYLCTPCGTGGTIAGLISSSLKDKKILGFPVLKGAHFLQADITNLVATTGQKGNSCWELIYDYHFGGYARYDAKLFEFISYFENSFDIPLDQVYTGKMMFGIYELAKKDYFPEGSKIIAIHTGGLQGRLKELTPITPHLP